MTLDQKDNLQEKFMALEKKVNLKVKKKRLEKLNQQINDPTLWQNPNQAKAILKEQNKLQKQIEDFELMELANQENDLTSLKQMLQKYENLLLFSGEYDERDVIFSIHAGQGGTEAMDWTSMLLRMYTRFFEKKGWEIQMMNQVPGEEAGLKSVTINVQGQSVYGFLKAEAGTHRLVRLSPFNANNLRQTSFALVEVLPVLDETEIEIKESDLDWQFFRSGGHGGQNVNKVSTAVRLIHLPTKIVVTCQEERVQQRNRNLALQILRGKLWQIKEQERQKKEASFKKGTMASWGSQIRSYVLHPYKQVKDLRTGYESQQPDQVLDGDLDPFIKAYLLKFA